MKVIKIPKKTHQPENTPTTTFIIGSFKLIEPRPTKLEEKYEWQHPTSHPIKTNTFTQHTDLRTQETQQNESEHDLYEIYRDAPDRYTAATSDKNNDEISNNLNEPEHETLPQNLPEPFPKNNFEPLQTQDTSEILTDSASIQKLPLIDDELQTHLTINKETDIPILLLSTNLTLKSKRHMYYFPMDFEKLTRDGSIDTGALTSAISKQDLNKIKHFATESISDTGSAPNFQIMVANGQLETPIGTVCLTFEVADFMFKENFIVMKVLPSPLNGLCFLNENKAIFDIRQGVLTFPHLSMQLKPEHNLPTRQSTPLLAEATYTLQPS